MVVGGFRVEVVPSLRKNWSCFRSWLADMGVSHRKPDKSGGGAQG